jgi:lipopolysaccharide heptosyltransferase II
MRPPLSQKEKQKIDPSDINKILLIRLRRIGDIIMTTPALSILRENFPHASISYVVEEPYRELVEDHPHVDEVLAVPENLNTRGLLRLIRRIRKQGFDAVLDFHSGPRASWITFFSGTKLKVGYKVKYRNFVYHIAIPRNRENEPYHSVENHVNLVKALGVEVSAIPPLSLPRPKREEIQKIKNFIAENRLHDTKVVVIHISAGNEFRNWGSDKIIGLIKRLSPHPEVKVVLVGTDEDRDAEALIIKESPAPIYSLVGQLNLKELRELIFSSSLFVGPDSGPMHIAASTPTPIVAYFGPTLPANFAPWKAKATLIEKSFDCRPCKQRQCIHRDFRCLRSIDPEEVYTACLGFLKGNESQKNGHDEDDSEVK